MSESQTKAGNQEYQSLNVIENFENFKIFENLITLKMILRTCSTSFVFMSMLKKRCLKLKMSMLFF